LARTNEELDRQIGPVKERDRSGTGGLYFDLKILAEEMAKCDQRNAGVPTTDDD
jgi:hypothetical protein